MGVRVLASKRDELDHFKVIIERDVDVRRMIPEKFCDGVEKFERHERGRRS